ncbi:MAG: isocitrate lyase/phosphoenolpyruvate mutase family protein [Deltaproteobacteria bacterium]|nr:isocitrate lyase/phosphoenolpyruvate mutase family protein [Deltaproteobacteria bacterium]
MNKAAKLREALRGSKPIVVAGAHNALSGKLVERAGYDAIWASGFEISASFALPDANILTATENLAVAKQISDAVGIPVIADCDNGYGNAINVMRTVEEYEKAGIAGICIEDNIFPKRCSFYAGVKRELVLPEEHAGKIRAAKEAQATRDFVVIARTEALIAGWGMEEALKRARMYAEAGADMILIHSKSKKADEILEFARNWTSDVPLVSVPTIYKETSVTDLQKAGFKMVIFANHGLRSAIKAMRETLAVLRKEEKAASVEDRVVSLEEVYELVGVSSLNSNEKKYLPVGAGSVKTIILAAGFEKELMPLVEDKPKGMLDIKGKTILERQIDNLNACNIKDIVVVRGYKKEKINLPNLRFYDSDRVDEGCELASLFRAESEIVGKVILLYGDIIFDKSILEKLLQSEADVSLVVDRAWYDLHGANGTAPVRQGDLVALDPAPAAGYRYLPSEVSARVVRIGEKLPWKEAHGEFIGMAMLSERGARVLRETYRDAGLKGGGKRFHEAESIDKASFTDLVQELVARGEKVAAVDIYKGWMEIDTFDDYKNAWATLRK